MSTTLSAGEEAQAQQTIEMFEVIAQSDPSDLVSLEILKEAYFKLKRHPDVLATSKRIAEAQARLGQLSSAILEYESILQLYPNDPQIRAGLAEIQNKAQPLSFSEPPAQPDATEKKEPASAHAPSETASGTADLDDGRRAMFKMFVDGKHIGEADFNLYWNTPSRKETPKQVLEPFIQILADKQLVPLDQSLKLICEKSRLGYLPLEKYDVDIELARSFPRETCLRWCLLPFDRLSKSVMVATANPFNQKAAHELDNFNAQTAAAKHFLWYVASPVELAKIIRKVFR